MWQGHQEGSTMGHLEVLHVWAQTLQLQRMPSVATEAEGLIQPACKDVEEL